MSAIAQLFQDAHAQQRAGHLFQAESEYRNILHLEPRHVPALTELGHVLVALGRPEAVSVYRAVLDIEPSHLRVLLDLGLLLHRQGSFAAACEVYRHALLQQPGEPALLLNYGVVLHGAGRDEDAIEAFRRALLLDPAFAAAAVNLGRLLIGQGRYPEAESAFRAAVAADPTAALSWCGLGLALDGQRRFAEALAIYDQALVLDDRDPLSHQNRGKLLLDLNHADEAVAAFERTVALDPARSEARFGLAQAYLTRGDYERGWPAFEYRNKMTHPLPGPVWQGEDLSGKTILVHHEQGYGDNIQMARYFALLRSRGARVLVLTHRGLTRLFSTIPGVEMVDWDRPLPHYDVRVGALSLPGLCGTTLTTIPTTASLFHIAHADIDRWSVRKPGRAFRVGLQWAGSRANANNGVRSIPLPLLKGLLTLPDIQWVSLQKDSSEAEQAFLRDDAPGVLHLGDRFEDFYDAASALLGLDLVISVDTAMAHLAGALGKPAWVMLRYSADWRWLLGREDSPWYPALRLFRQTEQDDWTPVLDSVATALRALA